jgi:hypothetical protein
LAELIERVLELDEALHLLVESFDLEVHLSVKIWDGTSFDKFNDIDITLNARLQI